MMSARRFKKAIKKGEIIRFSEDGVFVDIRLSGCNHFELTVQNDCTSESIFQFRYEPEANLIKLRMLVN